MPIQKADLIDEVAKRTGHFKKDVSTITDSIFETIADLLGEYKDVNIHKFGKFQVRNRKERNVKHPQTGEMMSIPESKSVGFKQSSIVKDKVNK